MGNYILALNCGSSSLKFTLFNNKEGDLQEGLSGVVEEIGNVDKSQIKIVVAGEKKKIPMPLPSHKEGLEAVFNQLDQYDIHRQDIQGVGHRVVHGGTKYKESVLINQKVVQTIEDLIPLAPLHNPANVLGIKVAMDLLPKVAHVAVFDTAFHASLPSHAYRYGIKDKWYKDYGVRTYGFHGTSHLYVSRKAAAYLGKPLDDFNGVTAHLGNGCSLTKILKGRSVDTSMGFTPLEGVIMGTRSGDIDPAVISHVVDQKVKEEGLDKAQAFDQVMHALNKESGLKALTGTNMMQVVREKAQAGDLEAESMIDLYAYKIAKYIGAYASSLPRFDALVFTAGLGENEGYVREKILNFLPLFQFEIDLDANAKRQETLRIATSHSLGTQALVIPTDEEVVIGYDTYYLGVLGESLPRTYPFE